MAFDRSSNYAAADAAADVYSELGRAYVEPGAALGCTILDAARQGILRAWVETLIPADGEWPSAADTPVVEYVDRTISLAARLRQVVLRALDDVDGEAVERHGAGLSALALEQRVALLRWFEDGDRHVFTLLKELTYEAYYRDPGVLEILERRTGFNNLLPVEGVQLDGYSTAYELLANVADRESLVRSISP